MKRDLDFDLSSEQLKVLVLAVGLVVSAVAISPGMVFGPTDAPDEAKSGVTYTSEPADTTVRGPPGSYESASLMSVPDGYTETSTPDASEPPEVRASAGAQTMQVTVTESDGEVALQLEDDRVHDGRWVSIPSQWFEAELGKVPEVAYVAHSSGDEYQTRLYTRGGDVAFYVEEFSTNTVTFSGEVSITGNFSDGGSAQYGLSDYDSASDPVVNLTGTVSTENETETGTAKPGDSSAVAFSGTGISGPESGNPRVSVSLPSGYNEFDSLDTNRRLWGDEGGTDLKTEIGFESPNQSFSHITVGQAGGTLDAGSSGSVDVYVVTGETPDNTYGEGTLVKSGWQPSESGEATVDFGQTFDTDGGPVTVEFISSGYATDNVALGQGDGSASSMLYSNNVYDGSNYYMDATLSHGPVDGLSVSTGSDSASLGSLQPGESASTGVAASPSTDALDWTASAGSGKFDWTVEYTEETGTSDASVELNSTTKTVSGTLNESETAQVTFNQSVLQEGTNQLNVSVGDGTLSSDAPTPMVGVELTHDAVDQQSVDYGGGQWTESYNVSETYASSRASAELTVPFQSNVYAIQNIEASVNGSSWSSVSTANYNLSDTTLTVDLTGVYGGEIPEGTEMRVRTTGTSVDPIAGTIQVTNPTAPGQPLNSTVEIVDWGPDSALDISGTPRGDRVHYVSEASWTPDEYSDFEGDGTHVLHLPNGSADNTITVRTLPLRIAPKQGDAHVSVPDGRVNRSEPVYRVTPGDTVGDAYDVTFTNATDGEDYILWSETNEIVVDSGTASSPLTLSDDEDNVAILQFMLDDGTSGSSSDSGSDSGGGPAPMPTTGGDTNFVPLIGVAIAGGLVIVASRNDGAVRESGANAAQSIEGTLGRVPIAGPALGKGLGGLVESVAGLLEAVVGNQTIALSIVTALLIGAVQGGIIEVPQSNLTIIIVGGVAIYTAVALRDLGEFTFQRWAAVLAATTVVAVQSLSSASLLTAIVESDVWPVLALSLVYLAYRGVQGLQQPDNPTNVVVEATTGEDEES